MWRIHLEEKDFQSTLSWSCTMTTLKRYKVQWFSTNMPCSSFSVVRDFTHASWPLYKVSYFATHTHTHAQLWKCHPYNVDPLLNNGENDSRGPLPRSGHLLCNYTGTVDSSGMRMWYTSTAREYDAGIFEIGHAVTHLHVIPPGAENFTTTGILTSECTNVCSLVLYCEIY